MIWSDDGRLLRRPCVTYGELAAANDARPLRPALRGATLLQFVIGRWFSRATGGPTILVDEEVTTRRYHAHGIGLTERVHAGAPLADVIRDIHAQGGLVIAAPP